MHLLMLTSRVLRDPKGLVEDHLDDQGFAHLAPNLLAITAFGAAIFGMVVGSYRGGLQVVYAGVKMPLLLLIPVVVSLPAVRAFFMAAELEVDRRSIGLASLTGMARTAVLAAAMAPVLWLFWSLGVDYHTAVLTLAAGLAVVGLPGMVTVVRTLPSGGRRRWMATAGSLVVLGLVTAQTGWLLRPFVARPSAEVTFVRPLEEDVFSSLNATKRSAVGDYEKAWEADAPRMYSLF